MPNRGSPYAHPPSTLQVAQRWRFASTPKALQKHGTPQVLPGARIGDLGASLAAKSYQVGSLRVYPRVHMQLHCEPATW